MASTILKRVIGEGKFGGVGSSSPRDPWPKDVPLDNPKEERKEVEIGKAILQELDGMASGQRVRHSHRDAIRRLANELIAMHQRS